MVQSFPERKNLEIIQRLDDLMYARWVLSFHWLVRVLKVFLGAAGNVLMVQQWPPIPSSHSLPHNVGSPSPLACRLVPP